METGFYYLQTRYYDPTICRFINADNYELVAELSYVPGELNMYAYCGNNPIMYTDETGEAFFFTALLVGFLVGAAIGGTVAGVEASNNGAEGWDLVGAIAEGALYGGAFGAAAGAVGGLGISAWAVGAINTGLSFANGVITTGIEQNWQFSGMDRGIIAGTSLLSGAISMRFYNQSAVKATNSFTSKIRGRISSGYYGTGARAVKSIASATAQANKMVFNTYFARGFYKEHFASLANVGLSQWGNMAKYYLP